MDLTRQTTDRNAVRVAGWTADPDAPQTPLTVRISVDGSTPTTVTANGSRPDVAQAHPAYGAAHGYDAVIPASATAQTVCVTAVNIGSGADNKVCQQVDKIVEFAANSISYDTANARITSTNLDQLYSTSFENGSTVQQSRTESGEETGTDTRGWSDTFGLKVTISTDVKIPIFEGKVSVEGSASFTQNGSHSTTRKFAWVQPLLVPARSRVDMTVAVTRSTLVVPYTMTGYYVYGSGERAAGSVGGTYSGVNSHHLQLKLAQFNLDGTPAARPVDQPATAQLAVR